MNNKSQTDILEKNLKSESKFNLDKYQNKQSNQQLFSQQKLNPTQRLDFLNQSQTKGGTQDQLQLQNISGSNQRRQFFSKFNSTENKYYNDLKQLSPVNQKGYYGLGSRFSGAGSIMYGTRFGGGGGVGAYRGRQQYQQQDFMNQYDQNNRNRGFYDLSGGDQWSNRNFQTSYHQRAYSQGGGERGGIYGANIFDQNPLRNQQLNNNFSSFYQNQQQQFNDNSMQNVKKQNQGKSIFGDICNKAPNNQPELIDQGETFFPQQQNLPQKNMNYGSQQQNQFQYGILRDNQPHLNNMMFDQFDSLGLDGDPKYYSDFGFEKLFISDKFLIFPKLDIGAASDEFQLGFYPLNVLMSNEKRKYPIFLINMQSGGCKLCLSNQCTGLNINVTHSGSRNAGETFIDMVKQFKCSYCCCCRRSDIKIFYTLEDSQEKIPIGYLLNPFKCCGFLLQVFDTNKQLLFQIKPEGCGCGLYCCKTSNLCNKTIFKVMDNYGNLVTQFYKNNSSLQWIDEQSMQNTIEPNAFFVDLGGILNQEYRALLCTAAIFLEINYYYFNK